MKVSERFRKLVKRVRNNDEHYTVLQWNYSKYWEVGDEGAEMLSDALRTNTVLMEIKLRHAVIGPVGAAVLGKVFEVNVGLARLCLKDNCIGNDGAEALGRSLIANVSLRELCLAKNGIGNRGAVALAEALTCKETLKELDLSQNKIGNDGTRALARALAGKSTLVKLDLANNRITSRGASSLAVALCSNSALAKLCLDSNCILCKGAIALACALQINRGLVYLSLDHCQVGREGTMALFHAAQDLEAGACAEKMMMTFVRGSFDGSFGLKIGLGTISLSVREFHSERHRRSKIRKVRIHCRQEGGHLQLPSDSKQHYAEYRKSRKRFLDAVCTLGVHVAAQQVFLVEDQAMPMTLNKMASTLGIVGVYEIFKMKLHLIGHH
uniref:Uncharacterized protein n=1 Tax=Trieres chinensis TaxID=1514140 RepID=A0A7S2EK30_TRICV|mmetsp:Transcript_26173/g.53608  ORF Transcript_26173/g.53608 Transcript_26173/m.53608 type:complete len:382 (+) Transcript_26173:120-1265(+)